ncbi:hypothetical protein [Streptomyces sp. NPDC047061]|uniref:hypothetical protein n=1 Tax=Streptomyces sp. NPDC047061 TaxID=3154605 RepID=UPI0033F1B498
MEWLCGSGHLFVTDAHRALRQDITPPCHAVRGADGDLTDILGRLREATANGEFAYSVPIAAAAVDRPRPDEPDIRRLDDEHVVLAHW